MVQCVSRGRSSQRRPVTSKGLVESSDCFALAATTSSAAWGADRFQYVITVGNAGQGHSVQMMDEATPAALSALLASLRDASMGGLCRRSVTRLDSNCL
jgi:hypothetical protein